MRLTKWLFIILVLFSVGHASAVEEGTYTATDTTYFEVDYNGTDNLIPYLAIQNIIPYDVSYLSVDTDTYNFTANITTTALKITADYVYYDKITGDTTSNITSWFRYNPFIKIYFSFGNPVLPGEDNWIYFNHVMGGTTYGAVELVSGGVYPASQFTIYSDAPVDLMWLGIDEELIYGMPGYHDEYIYGTPDGGVLAAIRLIPYVGEYVYQILTISGSILSAFVTLAYISIKNWTFFLVLFESFVFFHATSIMQNTSGKPSKLITQSFIAIAVDNKLLFDFLVNIFTKIIDMFVGIVRIFVSALPTSK